MDAGGSKKDPSLPPGYVSLEMLRKRWLRMQEEKNLKGEKEEEKRGAPSNNGHRGERVLENEGDRRRVGGLVRDPLRVRVEDSEGLIEVKEKGKEVVSDSGDVRKRKKKKHRSRKKSKRKDRESGNGDKIEDVEIVGDELKGVQGTEIVSRIGVGEQTRHPKSGGFTRDRGDRGFRRNDGDKPGHRGGKGYRFEPDDGMKESGVNLDLGKEQREGGRIITKRDGDGFGASKKDISEVTNGIRDLNNGFRGQKGIGRGKVQEDRIGKEYLMNDSVALEKTGQDELVAMERDERSGKGYRFKPDGGMKEGGVKLDLGKNKKEGGRIIIKGDGDGVAAFKKEVLEVTNGIRDLNNGFRGQKGNDGGKVQEDRIEKEYLMNDRVTMEKTGQDELVAKERDERGENWGSRRGFRRYGRRNRRGSFGRGFRGSTFGDWEAGNARSRMECNAGYGRGYDNRQNIHKVWVKKRETLGDAAAKNAPFCKQL